MMKKLLYIKLIVLTLLFHCIGCQTVKVKKNIEPVIQSWLTKGDQSVLFQAQPVLSFRSQRDPAIPVVSFDTTLRYQTIEGFGYTLTGGSAMLLQKMNADKRQALLKELFSCGKDGMCISYLRLSMGASDLDEKVFSYNDLEEGMTDPTLQRFSLSYDTLYLIPLIKQIQKINPSIRFIATSWSPPVWMKSNKISIGGQLRPEYYATYALYFVKYLTAMRAQGILMDAITIQNEPEHGGNNPSMTMTWQEQNDFIKNHLGPALKNARLPVKILVWDHNCDHPEYPLSILNDPETKDFVYGSAFHLYAGHISALSKVYEAHPDKKLYLTEQWTGAKGEFGGDLMWHLKNVVIGGLTNHSSVIMQWNLANDPNFRPHTPGGCTECKGALTIDGDTISKNVAFYNIVHASAFIPPGSMRIGSTEIPKLNSVAFLTPSGEKVMLLSNDHKEDITFQLAAENGFALITIPGESVVTLRF